MPCIDTDIQLKTLRHSLEVFNMKIIMRQDFVIFYCKNNKIDNAVRWCFSNETEIVSFEKKYEVKIQ